MFYGFQGKAREKKLSKFIFLVALTYVFLLSKGHAKDLGYCPKDPGDSCKKSLASALNILTNCPLDRPRIKECAITFVETFSEADHKAPFYEGFYEKEFVVGDVSSYKKEVESLKEYSYRAWLILHDLSKALILNYTQISALTDEQKREIENLVQPVFELSESRKFDINDQTHRDLFIQKMVKAAKAIEWQGLTEKMEMP